MASTSLLAFDLGAESGRTILGQFDGQRLQFEVIHRFPNLPCRVRHGLYWDVLRLWNEMKEGLRLAASQAGRTLASVGVDTWGVDFALLGKTGTLLGNPRHYRDPMTEDIMPWAWQKVSASAIYAQTGIQFMRFNSLFQLLALAREGSPLLKQAERLLFMPDLFHFWMGAEPVNEYTNASTSQCLDPRTRQWALPLLHAFQLPSHLFGRLVQPGTPIGTLNSSVIEETSLPAIPIIAPATHDTAAAVVAVPAQGRDWCYLSSGTWSLMGVERSEPLLTAAAQTANFTNEGGIDGTIRFLKNIMGLWLVQECRRAWQREGKEWSYDELIQQAEAAPALRSLVDPDDASFWLPPRMPDAIAAFCQRTGQAAPSDPGGFVRCALESLALRYRWVVEQIEALTGEPIRVVHVVGGGSQNRLLNQWTADATRRLVLAGPVEATALGNLTTQLMGLGHLKSLAEARQLIQDSFPTAQFEPRPSSSWEEAYGRWQGYLPKA